MSEFLSLYQNAVSEIESNLVDDFNIEKDKELYGKVYPLYASFGISSPKTNCLMMRLKGEVKCYEHCYVEGYESLTSENMECIFETAKKVHDEMVLREDPEHEFTFISFIVFTNDFNKDYQKLLKKYSDERKYNKPHYGWSSSRIAVVDLKNKKVYCNKLGDALKSRLKPVLQGI